MWLAIGFCKLDVHLAKANLSWISQLDSKLSHGALLCCDPSIDWSGAQELIDLAAKTFQRVEITIAPDIVESWPAGSNALFKTTAQFFQDRKIGPWLWLEPDAIPLRKGWLDQIEQAYFAAGKPFMGAVMQASGLNMPKDYLAGVACYPSDCWKRMSLTWDESRAFDVATAPATVPFAANTSLIQHFWGEKDLPPTFVAEKTPESPRNAFTLDRINPEAVIFHRCKDDSLLRLLGYRRSGSYASDGVLDIVLPFCWMDAERLIKGLRWLSILNGKIDRHAILHHDNTAVNQVSTIKTIAERVFSSVAVSKYRQGPTGWPSACNWAFQHACRYMASNTNRSWFWLEADATPIRKYWLDQIETQYVDGGQPFMGTIIGPFDGMQMGHMNGMGIYPPNVSDYTQRALTCTRNAWDTQMRDEMIDKCTIANHLIQHCAAIEHDCCKPANGPLPDFPSQREVDKWIHSTTVVFHPSKNGSLIDRLMERIKS